MSLDRKNVLLLGGTGFAGRHMAQLLAADHNVLTCGSEVDIREINAIRRVVSQCQPDWVVNFASITTVRESFENPFATYDIGFLGTLNVLTALKEASFSGRVLNISSSEVYGHPSPNELPISEASTLRPMSPYAVSKVAAEFLSYQWSRCEKTQIVTARPFTHIGPWQSERFAVSNFSKQIAEIQLGLKEPVMYVGDLSTTRDFTDVRDTVRAYRMLLENGESGEIYNVCSGMETALQHVLEQLIGRTGMAIRLETDKGVLRGAEQKRLLGSFKKIKQATHWEPEVSLEQTLSDALNFWLKKLRASMPR